MAKRDDDFLPFQNRKTLVLNEFDINISTSELQIPFKLYLGSEKDYEDVRYLYQEFKEKINKSKLINFVDEFKVRDRLIYLGDEFEK